MTKADVQFDPALGSRGDKIKLITFARETWEEAQASVSSFKGLGVTHKSLDGGNYKLFSRTFRREFVKHTGGIVQTPVGTQVYDRRALFSQPYHAATQSDLSDLIDNTSDIFADARSSLLKAKARLIDEVIVSAIVSPVMVETTGSTGGSTTTPGTGNLRAAVSLANRYKLNAYYAPGSGTAVEFDADTIEDILHIFAKRDVYSNILCTLTPELKNILRKDSDFKNAENIFAPMKRSVDDNRQGFSYKGINFISCSESILPVLDDASIGETAAATTNTIRTSVAVKAFKLDSSEAIQDPVVLDSNTNLKGSSDALKRALAVQAGWAASSDSDAVKKAAYNGRLRTITARSDQWVQFWCSEGLYYADRPEEMEMEMSKLPMLSLARQEYIRVSLGAMLIDEDFAMSVPIAGTVGGAIS